MSWRLHVKATAEVPVRIVSLIPSVTETLSEWDRPPIACTRFCERPDLLHVGGTKNPDVDLIVELRPDLVVMDSEENRRQDHVYLVSQNIPVHVLHVRSLLDVGPSLSTLAERLGVPWSPPTLIAPSARQVTAFIPIWRRPWMALGTPTYGASLLAHLGITTIFDADGPYPTIDLNQTSERRPNLVIAPSEPYPFSARHLRELERVACTIFVDGKDLFWWGVRTEGALTRLAEVFATL